MRCLVRFGKIFRAAACLAVLLPFRSLPAAAEMTCPADPAMPGFRLPHLRAALATRKEGVIVALGSSSTEGVMASDGAHTYPAVLQAALSQALPWGHVAVINRGIGGQDAPEELARLEADVVAVQPQLVIWQVGANGAMRNANPDEFHNLVTAGVQRLRDAGVDVILMDNQRSPKVLAAVEHIMLENELRDVAEETGVNLFSRSHLMDAWANEGSKPVLFTAADGLHHNDLGYYCVSLSLARGIAAAVTPPRTAVTARR